MEAIAEWEPYFQKDMLILVGKHLLVYLYFENLIATDIAGNRDMNIVIEAERDIWQRSESLILQSSKCSRDRVRSLNMDGRIPGDRGNKHPGRSREQPGALSKQQVVIFAGERDKTMIKVALLQREQTHVSWKQS